jgi:glycine dehydrogenase subunit 1
VEELNAKLMEHGILGGYDLSKVNPELGNAVLIAVTENRTKEEIDRFVEIMGVE